MLLSEMRGHKTTKFRVCHLIIKLCALPHSATGGPPQQSYLLASLSFTFTGDYIYYFDLEVDVIVKLCGEAGMIDAEELVRRIYG